LDFDATSEGVGGVKGEGNFHGIGAHPIILRDEGQASRPGNRTRKLTIRRGQAVLANSVMAGLAENVALRGPKVEGGGEPGSVVRV
jgi:hypothetical protein